MKPDISIVVPAFNVERYIGDAVSSALAQTGVSLEVIVVNDGSTDATGAIVSRFADPRVKVIAQENSGPSASRNRAIEASSGRYIGFLDGDDLWDSRKAAFHVELMDSRPEVDISYSWWRVIDQDGKFNGRSNTKRPNELPAGMSFEGLIVENFTGTASTLICRRSTVLSVGGFDEELRSNVDLDLLLRIARARDGNIALVPEVLTSYRIHGTQITADWRRMHDNWEKVFTKMRSLESDRVAAVERLARAHAKRYFAYIAYTKGDYAAARELVASAWRGAPMSLLRDRKAWLTTAAICSTNLPSELNNILVASAKRIRSRMASQ